MIEVNKNTLAGAFGALGKLICRTSPLALCKSIKVEATEGKLRLSICGLWIAVNCRDRGFNLLFFSDVVLGARFFPVGIMEIGCRLWDELLWHA